MAAEMRAFGGEFMETILAYTIENKILTKLTLSKSAEEGVIRATGRLIEIKGDLYLALTRFYTDGKAIQENLPAQTAAQTVAALIPAHFAAANMQTPDGNCEVKVSKKGKITLLDRIRRTQSCGVCLAHDRRKQYILSDTEPIDFLVALGVQDANGRIFDKKRPKFRQINRFLEIVADVEPQIGNADELYILDLCCGKSYLSFALYYYFTRLRGRKVVMDCVDLKADVIAFCGDVAAKLGYDDLHFTAGDIRDFPIRRQPDLTVSLHACDIATDIVLAKGIDSHSRVILSTPCCHHEMMHQLKPRSENTDFLLEHSILKQKFADAATDALRCKLLQIQGYDVEAIELIDPEETPKNVLIRAVRREHTAPAQIQAHLREYRAVCEMLGVQPYLAQYYELL